MLLVLNLVRGRSRSTWIFKISTSEPSSGSMVVYAVVLSYYETAAHHATFTKFSTSAIFECTMMSTAVLNLVQKVLSSTILNVRL
eukprot:SAG31_NODE_2006_length_6651_cov_29.411765_2_plen_85_part_00